MALSISWYEICLVKSDRIIDEITWSEYLLTARFNLTSFWFDLHWFQIEIIIRIVALFLDRTLWRILCWHPLCYWSLPLTEGFRLKIRFLQRTYSQAWVNRYASRLFDKLCYEFEYQYCMTLNSHSILTNRPTLALK